MVPPPKAASAVPCVAHGGATTVVGAVKLSAAKAGDGNARTARQAAPARARRRNMGPSLGCRPRPLRSRTTRPRGAVAPKAASEGGPTSPADPCQSALKALYRQGAAVECGFGNPSTADDGSCGCNAPGPGPWPWSSPVRSAGYGPYRHAAEAADQPCATTRPPRATPARQQPPAASQGQPQATTRPPLAPVRTTGRKPYQHFQQPPSLPPQPPTAPHESRGQGGGCCPKARLRAPEEGCRVRSPGVTCTYGWWARQGLNLRPLPCQRKLWGNFSPPVT